MALHAPAYRPAGMAWVPARRSEWPMRQFCAAAGDNTRHGRDQPWIGWLWQMETASLHLTETSSRMAVSTLRSTSMEFRQGQGTRTLEPLRGPGYEPSRGKPASVFTSLVRSADVAPESFAARDLLGPQVGRLGDGSLYAHPGPLALLQYYRKKPAPVALPRLVMTTHTLCLPSRQVRLTGPQLTRGHLLQSGSSVSPIARSSLPYS